MPYVAMAGASYHRQAASTGPTAFEFLGLTCAVHFFKRLLLCATIAVLQLVFLDEAGLPPRGTREPLKVLHYYLEESVCACVLISNRPLDAAKMNRTVCVQRPEPDVQELQLLLADAMGFPSDPGSESHKQPVVTALCKSYWSLMNRVEPLLPGGTSSTHLLPGQLTYQRSGAQ
jgi:hypothetical protein